MGVELDEEGVDCTVYVSGLGGLFVGHKITKALAKRHSAYNRLFALHFDSAVV